MVGVRNKSTMKPSCPDGLWCCYALIDESRAAPSGQKQETAQIRWKPMTHPPPWLSEVLCLSLFPFFIIIILTHRLWGKTAVHHILHVCFLIFSVFQICCFTAIPWAKPCRWSVKVWKSSQTVTKQILTLK